MNIIRGLSYKAILAGNVGIALSSPQISGTCIPSTTATQDIWQKDLDNSLNAKLWQHIWGSVFKAVWEIDCNKFSLIFFPEPASPYPDRVIDRYLILEMLKMQSCYSLLPQFGSDLHLSRQV